MSYLQFSKLFARKKDFDLFNFMFSAVLLFGDSSARTPKLYGTIDPNCDVPLVVEDAFNNAKFLCDQYYFGAPDLNIEVHNGKFHSYHLRCHLILE